MSNARLIAALEEAARHQPIRLPLEWYFPTSLRAAPPARAGKPSEPPEPLSTGIVPAEPYEAPAAVEDKEFETDLPQAPVWLLRADISVWRTRWLWPLVGSFVLSR